MKTREQFLAAVKKNRFPVLWADDAGVWHGQDFLYPGAVGSTIADFPADAKHCQNPCCDCFRYMSPEAHRQEFGW